MTRPTAKAEPIYLYHRRPRCPVCGSPALKVQRSVDNGDGSRTRYSKCQDCGSNVVVVVE